MEKNALLAFILSIAVLAGWFILFPQPKPVAPVTTTTMAPVANSATPGAPTPATATSAGATIAKPGSASAAPTAGPQVNPLAKDTVIDTNLYTAVLSETGGRLKSFKLKKYKETNDPKSGPKELITQKPELGLPMGLSFIGNSQVDLQTAYFKADKPSLALTGPGQTGQLIFTYLGADGLQVNKIFTFSADSYLIDMDVKVNNQSATNFDHNLVLGMVHDPFMVAKKYSFQGLGALINKELMEIKPKDLDKKLADLTKAKYSLNWAGVEDQYFLAATLPKDKENSFLKASALADNGVDYKITSSPVVLAPKAEKEYQFQFFFGPKDYFLLKSLKLGLERSIYFGWFDIIAKPIMISMISMYKVIPNYGVIIILLTLIIKLIFWPLTAKSYRSMKELQKLQPKFTKLREKYKDDREALNRETMQLYKTYKVNPMSGCLPMLIQIPVFIALYRLLDYSIQLRHAPFMLWIHDLSAPDRLFHFSGTFPFMQAPLGIPILTILMGITMFIQQKMSPTTGDPMQAKMMMLMPVIFTVLFINFPAGLVLYWLTNNVLSIGQQYMVNKSSK